MAAKNTSKATLFFRNGHLLLVTIAIVIVAGLSSLTSMPRLEDPVITTRNAQIITLSPGSSAERVEALINRPIEIAMAEIPEIKNIDTTARANLSIVAIELADSVTAATNKEIFSRVRDQLDEARRQFPEGTLEPNFDDQRGAVAYTFVTGITWTGESLSNLNILSRKAEILADQLRQINGTDIVRIFGEAEEEITVTVRPDDAAALGVTMAQVAAALDAADPKLASGMFRGGERQLLLEVAGTFDAIEQVRRTALRTAPGENAVFVGDVADVRKGVRQPVPSIARSDGQRSVFVAARVQEDQRADIWTAETRAIIDDFRTASGGDIAVETVFEQTVYTEDRLGQLAFNLFLGALVVQVIIFFTMGWRSALIVGSALPLTAAMTIGIYGFAGGKLHQMSIFGMIIALGLLIDTAIVITDEISHHLREGADRQSAVRKAVKHLFVPLLSSTSTTILAFMPILLLPGNAGDFVGSIGESVVVALASSFFISITVIASLAGKFVPRRGEQGWLSDGLTIRPAANGIRCLLECALRHPLLTMGISLVIPATGFFIATQMGVQFFPLVDRDQFEVEVYLPTESSLAETQRVAEAIEAAIREEPVIERVDWLVGESFPPVYYNLLQNKDNSAFYAQAIVTATNFREVARLVPQLQKRLGHRFPGAQIIVSKFGQGPPAEAGVEFRLYGPQIDRLQEIAEGLRRRLAEHPDIITTRVTLPPAQPKLMVVTDEDEVRLLDLNRSLVAAQLQGSTEGFTGGSLLEDVAELPVRVRLPETIRGNVDQLANLSLIAPGSGQQLPLDTVARLELTPESGGVTRRNAERVNIIRGWVRTGALPIDITRTVLEDFRADNPELPDGYRLRLGGDAENQSDAVGNLLLYVPVLVTMTIAILVLSFRSARLAAVLGSAAFLSVGFGLLATYFYGLPLSFNTILGSFGLIGLAFNDNIVVLASIRQTPGAREGDLEAIRDGALRTLRHLVSTTLTTIGSFIPLLVFVGGEFWPPLAIVLAGGVGGATLLALFYTPSAYVLSQRLSRSRKT